MAVHSREVWSSELTGWCHCAVALGEMLVLLSVIPAGGRRLRELLDTSGEPAVYAAKGDSAVGNLRDAVKAQLRGAERPSAVFEGLSAGLNARSHIDRGKAVLYVMPNAVLVGFVKPGFPTVKTVVERFSRDELMELREGDEPITGIAGAMARKSSSHALGRAMGASSTVPAITLITHRGDLVFAFKPKERGLARQAYVAIAEEVRQ